MVRHENPSTCCKRTTVCLMECVLHAGRIVGTLKLSVFKELFATSSIGTDQHLQNPARFLYHKTQPHLQWFKMCFAGVLRKADAWEHVPHFSIHPLLWWRLRYQEESKQIKKKDCRYGMFGEICLVFSSFKYFLLCLLLSEILQDYFCDLGKAIGIGKCSLG